MYTCTTRYYWYLVVHVLYHWMDGGRFIMYSTLLVTRKSNVKKILRLQQQRILPFIIFLFTSPSLLQLATYYYCSQQKTTNNINLVSKNNNDDDSDVNNNKTDTKKQKKKIQTLENKEDLMDLFLISSLQSIVCLLKLLIRWNLCCFQELVQI